MEIIAYVSLIIISLIGVALLLKTKALTDYSNRCRVLLIALLILIVAVRIYKFSVLPGLDCDEAMGGINSWSLGKYGLDYFNLSHNPIYLFAWGAGMNILYPLITVPFVKAFGLSLLTYRYPIIVINLVAIFLFAYSLLKLKWKSKSILVSLMVIFLSPWTIQSSRWAVESNLFPPLIIIATSFFILSYVNITRRKVYLFISMIIIAVSAYSYSSNWIFLALFTIFICSWLLKNKVFNVKNVLSLAGIYLILLWPLFLFLYVNYISHTQIKVLGMTITKLNATRSVFVIANGGEIGAIFSNIGNVAKMFITGFDGWPKTGLPTFGALYPFMLAFFFIGVIFYFFKKKHSEIDTYMMLMLLSCIPSVLLIAPSWTHYNALMLPVLYFEAKGVIDTFKDTKMLTCFSVIFLAVFAIFSYSYFNRHNQELLNGINNTPSELKTMIRKADKTDKHVYLITSRQVNETNVGAIYVLPIFYTQIDPWQFAKETRYAKAAEFTQYDHYGKWRLMNEETSRIDKNGKGAIYIIQNGSMSKSNIKKLTPIQRGTYYTMYRFG